MDVEEVVLGRQQWPVVVALFHNVFTDMVALTANTAHVL